MLCEIRTTARPCSASFRTRSSTWRVWATPRAAVGSSRITSFEFHSTAFATATDWRWPPEGRERLAPQVHVLYDVEVVAEREVLVHDLDPEPPRVLRPVDVHRLALP